MAPPPAPVEAPASAEADVSAEATLDGGTSAEAQAEAPKPAEVDVAPVKTGPKPPILTVEQLPPEAYPNTPLRGLEGGSLYWVINRLQWPYMPAYENEPNFRIGFSGYSWLDSNFREVKAGREGKPDETEYRMQGRFVLRVTPVFNFKNNWFLQSNLELVGITEQNHAITNYVDLDEAWIRFGKWKKFDLTIGRTQGFEVYHFGMGLDLNTYERAGAYSDSTNPTLPYGLTDLWDRGINNGAFALHWYAPEWLRLELLGRIGTSTSGTDVGVRPVGVIDLGWMKLKGGYERRLSSALSNDSNARIEMQGWGGSLQFVLDPWIEFGASAGHRLQDTFEADGGVRDTGSHTTTTVGGFLNFRPYFKDWLVGVGYHHTYFENFKYDAFGRRENDTHQQMFAAVQYVAWKKLYIKYVLAYGNAHIMEADEQNPDYQGFTNEALSSRLRFQVFY